MHGWFSLQMFNAALELQQHCGSYYQTPEGKEVLVTAVTQTSERPNINWNDLVYVGSVTKHVESYLTRHSPALARQIDERQFNRKFRQ